MFVQQEIVAMEGASEVANMPPLIEENGMKSKKRDQSVDALASLKNKLTRVKINVGEILEWKDIVDRLVGDISYISVLKEEVLVLINTLSNKFYEKTSAFEAKVNMWKAAIARGATTKMTSHTEAPKPLEYGGKHDPKLLEDFFGPYNVISILSE